MDTISVKLLIGYEQEVNLKEMEYARSYIDNITSPSGHKYCSVLEINCKGEFVIKISYPRFYSNNNAYLIKDEVSCKNVNFHFIENIGQLSGFPFRVANIVLIRVDIPFTYIADKDYHFWHYENIYRIFAIVYTTKNKNANPKMISTILDKRVETLNYADTRVSGNYNSKIMIYNQYANLEDKLEDFQLKNALEEFPNLQKRIRMEVSKRIKRNIFSLDEFKAFNIYGEYYTKFRDYILINFLDLEIIEEFYNNRSRELASMLETARSAQNFRYDVFILNNMNLIFDYEIIRRALKLAIPNDKTREGATTAIRKILYDYQVCNDIILMDVYSHLKKIEKMIREDLC